MRKPSLEHSLEKRSQDKAGDHGDRHTVDGDRTLMKADKRRSGKGWASEGPGNRGCQQAVVGGLGGG